jgi:hypothetical protein
MRINYINLTNGIEAIPAIPNGYRFVRIQSTMCEQHNCDRIIQDLDYDFLMNIAIGNECYIYDYGTNKPIPRAIYQGVEFLKYVLYKRWLDKEYLSNCNRKSGSDIRRDSNSYFESCYMGLDKRTKKKLDYFKPYVTGQINIFTITGSTIHDNDKKYYREILLKEIV